MFILFLEEFAGAGVDPDSDAVANQHDPLDLVFSLNPRGSRSEAFCFVPCALTLVGK